MKKQERKEAKRCNNNGKENRDLLKKLRKDNKQGREEENLNLKDFITELWPKKQARLNEKSKEKKRKTESESNKRHK